MLKAPGSSIETGAPIQGTPGDAGSASGSGEHNGQIRGVLQRSSGATLRRHALRFVARVATLVGLDLTGFFLARGLVRWLRDGQEAGSPLFDAVTTNLPTGYLGGSQFILALVVGLTATGAYGRGDHWRDPSRILLGVALASALTLWSSLWQATVGMAILRFLVTSVALGLLLVGLRGIVAQVLKMVRGSGRYQVRSILVADEDDLPPAESTPLFRAHSAFRLTRRIAAPRSPGSRDVLMAFEHELSSAIRDDQAETVFVAGSLPPPVFAATVDIALASGAELVGLSHAMGVAGVAPRYSVTEGVMVTHLTRTALRGHELLVKRALDVVGAALALVLLSPLLLTIAVAIRLSSSGPVLFRQVRVGLGGQTFRMYKFRSMQPDAEFRRDDVMTENIYEDLRLFKLAGDPRITPLGKVLRRFSLDELPQLINVLRGEMSLVGPRPPIPSEVALYEGHHYCRFDVPPGMTGPWQVNGRNEITDFEQVVVLERNYIQNWSVWLDVRLLLATIPAVLRGTGAH